MKQKRNVFFHFEQLKKRTNKQGFFSRLLNALRNSLPPTYLLSLSSWIERFQTTHPPNHHDVILKWSLSRILICQILLGLSCYFLNINKYIFLGITVTYNIFEIVSNKIIVLLDPWLNVSQFSFVPKNTLKKVKKTDQTLIKHVIGKLFYSLNYKFF